MKRYIIIGALLASAITQAHADPSSIDNFFHANYNVTNLAEYANRQVSQVSYVLIDWNECSDLQQRYLNGGYVKLGESDWQETGGIPYRDEAISYARFIGADAIVYTMTSAGKFDTINGIERTDHRIGFYARAKAAKGASVSFQAASSEDQIVQAEATLQRAWDRLPTAKKNALRADQRAWIQRKDAATELAKLAMIKDRTAYLAGQ